jgi:hypothetical protein
MRRGAWAWLVVFGLMGPAGAQEVRGGGREDVDTTRLPEDIPDNMDAFRRTPQTDDQPQTDEQVGLGGAADTEGTGGAGTAGTDEEEKPEAERPEAPKP